MERRHVLATTGIALSAPLAGCLSGATERNPNGGDTDRTVPEITASELDVAVGESATLTVNAVDVVGVQVWPDADGIEFGFDVATLAPPPAFTYQMYPPMWHWDTASTVEIEIPVVVDDDAQPGNDTYEVRGFARDLEAVPTDVELEDEEWADRWERRREQFTITITE